MTDQTTPLRDRIAAALYERERPPGEPAWVDAYPADREVFEAMADAVLAVLPAPADRAADEVDADTVANRAAQVITAMGAEIRELKHSRDRYRTAWFSARQRAQALGEGILRHVADRDWWKKEAHAVQARSVVENRAAVLRDAANALAVLGPVDSLVPGPKAWAEAVETLRRMADETATTETQADDLPASLEAALTERYTELGNPFSEMRRQEKGPDGWPASHPVGPHHVAETLRELLAAGARQDGADRG
ncbi:hypothetical protein [Streptomyces rochei]